MMTTPDLKPCPFCGGEGNIASGREWWGARSWHIVYCKECCAGTGEYTNVQMAIDAWNERTNDEGNT